MCLCLSRVEIIYKEDRIRSHVEDLHGRTQEKQMLKQKILFI